jgi:hypothetical protein
MQLPVSQHIAHTIVYTTAHLHPLLLMSLHAYSPLTNRCVPAASAHLDGAQQITLQGVKHSMDSATAEWYGSESVIDG